MPTPTKKRPPFRSGRTAADPDEKEIQTLLAKEIKRNLIVLRAMSAYMGWMDVAERLKDASRCLPKAAGAKRR
ncbi:MAG: hypothetical protein PHE27_03500 [Alphaproteobacteria bacterium]|nr:hypothetical protein [Alphaproteobacteria bacterium]